MSQMLANNKKPNHDNEIVLTISYSDYENLLKIFDEMGNELGRFREDLLSHQNKVRRTLLDVGGVVER